MLPKIRIFTFGTLQVVRGDHAVTESDWHTRQARQLLKILITERPRPVSTDRLIEILWPNSTPSAAATTLRSAINALRNVLEPDRLNRAPSRYVITQAPGYAFAQHPDILLDVELLEAALDKARHSGEMETRRHFLEEAIALYKDDYLISDPYADWVQNERIRLQELFFNALLQLAEIEATTGNYASAIAACRQILARDEVRENAHQDLMRYQAESGDSAAALLTYERCRALLAEELGADPSPLTQSLHRRILNGEIETTPSLPLSHVLRNPRPIGFHNQSLARDAHRSSVTPQRAFMPVVDMHFAKAFVGREQEMAMLESKLQQALAGQGDLVVLEGEAGIGKTRLAYHLLQRAANNSATVFSVTCQALEQPLPFAPLADSIGRYLHSLPDPALADLPAATLSQLAQIIPSLQDRLPDLSIPVIEGAIGADENRRRLIDAVVAFLAHLSQQRPLVFFIDDLHWADLDSLAVVSRLSQRIADLHLFMLLAYRTDDLAENEGLVPLLHSLRRGPQTHVVPVDRLSQHDVHCIVSMLTGQEDDTSVALAESLYAATQGNALFVTEALRDLVERHQLVVSGEEVISGLSDALSQEKRRMLVLGRNQRVQEVILERIERLPAYAQDLLQVASVIGRDFSLELMESVAMHDPIEGLQELLKRKFLVELPGGRLDFSHQVARRVVYDNINSLLHQRLHLRVANALDQLGRAHRNPREAAFHFGQAGHSARMPFAQYSVLAGEKLLRSFGFRQAVIHFDQALEVLEGESDFEPDLIRRALQGRGLAHESLLDADGVADTYGRLQKWANEQGERELMLATHSRLTSMLSLLGRQRESNRLLGELFAALSSTDSAAARSHVIADLLARRRLIYSIDNEFDGEDWTAYVPPPPVATDPVGDVLRILEPAYAVLPLFDYGWTLLVQGQLGAATHCLEAVVDLASDTAQPSIASTAYHQLAVTARILGDLDQSQRLNEKSIAINREVPGPAAELASMWPRISSAFLSLQAGRLDEAAWRFNRVVNFLDGRDAFHNYRHSANVGLGLVALARGDLRLSQEMLDMAVADPVNLYPYTHVRALLGLARIAHMGGNAEICRQRLSQALLFAGRRSLLEEYIETVLEIARLRPQGASVEHLMVETLAYVQSIHLDSVVSLLKDALRESSAECVSI